MLMLELLKGISNLGTAEAENLLVSAGESILKNLKSAHDWKKILVDTGEFFIENEKTAAQFFDDLSLVLAKDNMVVIAKNLKDTDGYELKNRLYKMLMQLMAKYEIHHELAESYCLRIMYVILEQIKVIAPDKYEHYFLQEWKDEQQASLEELHIKIDKMSKDNALYQRQHLLIESSGQMDIELRRSTDKPSIGIEFFKIDDEHFQEEFEEHIYDELVYVRGRCQEETIYCILNELWRLNEKRPIYVVKSLESWQKLQNVASENNIYIPWFFADEIVAIENNTNIFVLNENMPAYTRNVIELRPRTLNTISHCLQEAGMESDEAYALIADTHGLYIPMKKRLFRGEYQKRPQWMDGISDKVKKICLLLGKWEETEGDKLIIETLYGGDYENFLEEILSYTKGEDPFVYVIKGSRRNHAPFYCLASTENTWEWLDVSLDDSLWKRFIDIFIEVLNESENLFTYSAQEKLLAQIKGEKLFWSETIRKGMVRTLIMKGCYRKTKDCQPAMDEVIDRILNYITTEKQWSYISTFWTDLCEISPKAVLARLEREFVEPTGLLGLFEHQSDDFLFGRNAYINILWGVEQFLVQDTFAWDAFHWLLKLDSLDHEYKSNAPRDIFDKIFCTWYNFSAITTPEKKIEAAKLAIQSSGHIWTYLYEAVSHRGRSILGELSAPKYREHRTMEPVTIGDVQTVSIGYINVLLNNMDFSAERWNRILKVIEEFDSEIRKDVFNRLMYEVTQMTDYEIIDIKNNIREIIYRHRYFASSSWAMSENRLQEYEELLDEIYTSQVEYEYGYLFYGNREYPLLHPVPYETEGEKKGNECATEKLVREKLLEFQNKNYRLEVLAELSGKEPYNSLGSYLAKYWKDGKWDFETFEILLKAQPSGSMAVDYMTIAIGENVGLYPDIILKVREQGYSDEVLAKIYRSEAFSTENVPLISNAPNEMKTIFWKGPVSYRKSNVLWAVSESKNHSSLDIFLQHMYRLHHENPLSAWEIYSYMEGIEGMQHTQNSQMTDYYMKQFLEIMQKEFLHDEEKCLRISQIEIYFMNLLEWDNMKCFHHIIKKSPELFAMLVAGIYKRDHEPREKLEPNEQYIHNMYTVYDKAHFCPAEEDGKVKEEKLRQWVETFSSLLEQNDQSSLFGSMIGRLFAFSPCGEDGHEPCEAVRALIEDYCDDRLCSSYESGIFNRRGIYSPSAGKEEMRMAEDFKANAEYLNHKYPKTAKIFYSLYDRYKRESERARTEAENEWY
ncbi:MAG: hypothetical protein NC417_08650 [Candidatus Gastranaerophilales bacterium]|nr:hypothetical protein [Candidatus Gastranaerophilales bacterium]